MDGWRGRRRAVVRLSTVALTAILLVVAGAWVVHAVTEPKRTTPVYDPPVLAGQRLWGFCSAGFYARLGETIVLTSSGHCTGEGTVARDPEGAGSAGSSDQLRGRRPARIPSRSARRRTSTTSSSRGTASRGAT